jgi:pantoate--beta-alanine ligase
MGALHLGHISLIEKALNQTDIVVCSIFVNPTQFNDKSDLDRYPRTFEKDKMLLIESGCHFLFYPEVNEMYPTEDTRTFDFGFLGNTLDGFHRPGHFNGVGQIVSKLFDAVQPVKAFFGEKDFQQVLIVKNLTKQLHYNIEIISCEIAREKDGLAMSSRNMLLSEDERNAASKINLLLNKADFLFKKGKSIQLIKSLIIEEIKQEKLFKMDYFEARNPENLNELQNNEENVVFLIALFCGKIRLIDNCVSRK